MLTNVMLIKKECTIVTTFATSYASNVLYEKTDIHIEN